MYDCVRRMTKSSPNARISSSTTHSDSDAIHSLQIMSLSPTVVNFHHLITLPFSLYTLTCLNLYTATLIVIKPCALW